jgi:hypothetical protein
MAQLIDQGANGHATEMGGPEVLGIEDIVRSYLEATKKRRAVATLPVPGRAIAGFRAGHNLAPDHADGRITWGQWLSRNAAAT